MNFYSTRTWAEINMTVVADNYRLIRRQLRDNTKVCCVIKANAYGHGAVELAKKYAELGAEFFAVSNLDEAMQLREAGLETPILILGYTNPANANLLGDNKITQCIFSLDYARALSEAASTAKVLVTTHLKLDTGMTRIGFRCKGDQHDELDQAVAACQLPHLSPEGVFMHFAVADEGNDGKEFTLLQYKRFLAGIEQLKENGIEFQIRHCANSAAIFDYPEFQLDMVRAGIVLYGLQPSNALIHPPKLKPVMTLKSVVSQVKTVHEDDTISYGRTYRATDERVIATVPVGYADGFYRLNGTGKYSLLIHGQPARITGRVCMDQLMVDVTGLDCKPGDEVTIFGDTAGHTASDIAEVCGTINYEVTCDVAPRVPRKYI